MLPIDLVPQGNGEVQRPLMSKKLLWKLGHLRILPHLNNGNDYFNEHQHHPFFKICHSNRDRPRSSWRSVPIAAGVSGLVEAGILAADQRIFMDERIGFGEDQWRFGQGIFMIYSWWFWFRQLKWPHELIFFWLYNAYLKVGDTTLLEDGNGDPDGV